MKNKELTKGALKILVLKMLAENGPMYGYQICKVADEMSGGEMKITEGALYPALHKMQAEGILVAEQREVGNRKRKYYRLNKKGKEAAESNIAEMGDFISLMIKMFNLKPKTN